MDGLCRYLCNNRRYRHIRSSPAVKSRLDFLCYSTAEMRFPMLCALYQFCASLAYRRILHRKGSSRLIALRPSRILNVHTRPVKRDALDCFDHPIIVEYRKVIEIVVVVLD